MAFRDPKQTPALFRSMALAFAFALTCSAVWVLTPELISLSAAGVSNDVPEKATGVKRDSLALAASIAVVRGDLWAKVALTYFDLGDGNIAASDSVTADAARTAAYRALQFAPHDAKVWLFLASIDSRLDWLNKITAACLRMSFYTGANELDLIPTRLILATQSAAIADADFQQLVRHDINTILTRGADMTFAIANAYREAPPAGQRFIEEALTAADPSLLRKIINRR